MTLEQISPLKDFIPGKALENYGSKSDWMKDSYWNNILDSYGATRLTFPTDRLIALSGIAREVQKVLKTTYIAGMWQDQLPDSLLWGSYGDSRCAVAPKYIAPSWRWASVPQPIHTANVHSTSVRPFATILDVGVTLANLDDPFGQITDGYLHIRGKLGVMKWSGAQEEPSLARVQPAGADLNLLGFSTTLRHHASVQRMDLSMICMDDESVAIGEGWQAYVLPLLLPERNGLIHHDPKRLSISGLLLAYLPCEDFKQSGTENSKDSLPQVNSHIKPNTTPSEKFKRIGTAYINEKAVETFQSLTDCDITII
jgi:hypothetical protein